VDGTGASPAHIDVQPAHRVHSTACSNAYAERFVLTARTELTDAMLTFGERPIPAAPAQPITRRAVLGRLLTEYPPAA
jgi:hypothetical protein